MPLADDLTRLPPGTRVRLYHLTDGERRATSGTVVVNDGTVLRVRPLSGGPEQTVEIASVDDFTVAGAVGARPVYRISTARVLSGALLFGLLGLAVSGLNRPAAPDYPVWAAYGLFGFLVGALPERIPVGRVLLGAALFSALGLVIVVVLSLDSSGEPSDAVIYKVMGGFGLFGAGAGVFLGIGNPLHLLLLGNPLLWPLLPLLRLERRARERWEAEQARR